VEVLTRSEVEALEMDNPVTPRFPVASAFAHRGGNRITVITDNIQKKVVQANQAQGEDRTEVLAWNMPAFFEANGGTDFRRALQYTLAHEMGHTYDVNAGKGTPGWEYNMSGQREELMKMIDAGGMGRYGMSTAGGDIFNVGTIENWQVWEGIAEAFAQMVLHDKFQPDDLKQPAVIEFMRLFGFI
jgi:hypothetical protein